MVEGECAIRVKAYEQSGADSSFTVLPPIPVVNDFSPVSAAIGASITLNGANFRPTDSEVTFNWNNKTYRIIPEEITPTYIRFKVPDLADGDYTIEVGVAGQITTAARKFNVKRHPPRLETANPFEPAAGLPGSSFTIFGEEFNPYAEFDTVTFIKGDAAVNAAIARATASALTVKVPAGLEPGVYQIKVASSGQSVLAAEPFTVLPPPPVITNFSPASTKPGEVLTITGTHFGAIAGEHTVTFVSNNTGISVTTSVIQATSTSLTVTIPVSLPPDEYQIRVHANGQIAVSSELLIVIIEPKITSITPASGTPNSTITINGSGFSTVVANNKAEFVYGANEPLPATVTGAAYNTLMVKVPASVTAGQSAYTVRVTVYGKIAQGYFTVTNLGGAPTITSFNGVTSVNRGSTLTIIGTHLKASGVASSVHFTPWPGSGVSTIVSGTPDANGTSLTVTVPAGLFAGQYEVSVEVNGMHGSSPERLEVK